MSNDLTSLLDSEFSLRNSVGLKDRISENFYIYELIRSEIAERNGIDNFFQTDAELRHAVCFAREILQPVRNEFGSYSPNSIYRCQQLERALKHKPLHWLSKSQHTKGVAGDIEVNTATNMELARWIVKTLSFDQIILECYDAEKGANSGWVHVSYVSEKKNRNNVLSYVKNPSDGRFVYVNGLQETP